MGGGSGWRKWVVADGGGGWWKLVEADGGRGWWAWVEADGGDGWWKWLEADGGCEFFQAATTLKFSGSTAAPAQLTFYSLINFHVKG